MANDQSQSSRRAATGRRQAKSKRERAVEIANRSEHGTDEKLMSNFTPTTSSDEMQVADHGRIGRIGKASAGDRIRDGITLQYTKTSVPSNSSRSHRGMKGIPALRPTSTITDTGTRPSHDKSSKENSQDSGSPSEDDDSIDQMEEDLIPKRTLSNHEGLAARMQVMQAQGAAPSSMHYLMKRVQAFNQVPEVNDEPSDD